MARPSANPAFEAAIVELDAVLNLLHRRYESYFLGIDRIEPGKERVDLRRQLMALRREPVQNTALKFRLNSLWSKYLSHERMWERTSREIEEGTYHRDVFKAKMRQKARAEADQQITAQATAGETVKKAIAANRPNGKARPKRSELSDDHVNKLYKAFMMAKKRCKEDTTGLTKEAMRRSLEKQIPQIKKKHNAKSVDFKIVIKGGKAVLKAVPRR